MPDASSTPHLDAARMRVLLALAALALLAPAASASGPPYEWQGYSGVPVGVSCAGVFPGCPGLSSSGVQFGPFVAQRADIVVRDQTGLPVGASYAFYAPDGTQLAKGGFCGAAPKLQLPEGAQYVVVIVDTPVTAQHCGVLSSGTGGYVGLRLRD